jgi:hypothetical protein
VQRTIAIAVNQTTRVRFVVWILFNDFTGRNAYKHPLNRNPIRGGFLISMITNPDAIRADGFGNLDKFNQREFLTGPRPDRSPDSSAYLEFWNIFNDELLVLAFKPTKELRNGCQQ